VGRVDGLEGLADGRAAAPLPNRPMLPSVAEDPSPNQA
jgi:hypothetical protein